MKFVIICCIAAVTLTACGVDGQPLKPKVSTKTTFGFNSKTGAYNNTELGIKFGG